MCSIVLFYSFSFLYKVPTTADYYYLLTSSFVISHGSDLKYPFLAEQKMSNSGEFLNTSPIQPWAISSLVLKLPRRMSTTTHTTMTDDNRQQEREQQQHQQSDENLLRNFLDEQDDYKSSCRAQLSADSLFNNMSLVSPALTPSISSEDLTKSIERLTPSPLESSKLSSDPHQKLAELPTVFCESRARIPTTNGAEIYLHLYKNNIDDKEHLAIVFGQHVRSKTLFEPRPGETRRR